jgi:hypothetical protein
MLWISYFLLSPFPNLNKVLSSFDLIRSLMASLVPESSTDGQSPQLSFDQEIYDKVVKGLFYPPKGKGPTVGWESASASLEQAARSLDRSETQTFLAKCFHDIINIFLDQQPLLLHDAHRAFVESTFHSAIFLLAEQLRLGVDVNIKVLALFLQGDSTRPVDNRNYFKGAVSQGYRSLGAPEVRASLLLDFLDGGGFASLAGLFAKYRQKGAEAWLASRTGGNNDSAVNIGMGCGTLRHLLSGLHDALAVVISNYPERLPALSESAEQIVTIVSNQVHPPAPFCTPSTSIISVFFKTSFYLISSPSVHPDLNSCAFSSRTVGRRR